MADKQLTLNQITVEGLQGDEHKAALLKIEADHLERAAKIAKAEAQLGLIRELRAVHRTIRTNLLIAAEEKKENLRKESVRYAKDLAAIDAKGLSPLDEKLRKLALEVKHREKILSLAGSLQARDQASADLAQSKANQTNAIRQAGLSGMQTPDTFGRK
jgi:hypothetical protein